MGHSVLKFPRGANDPGITFSIAFTHDVVHRGGGLSCVLKETFAMGLSVEAFLARLDESGVTTPDEVSSVLSTFPNDTQPVDGDALAKVLVERQLLTEFQVRTILNETGEPLSLGPYVVLEPLGQGGTGTVFKGWHRHMKRYVALKVLHADLSESSVALQRFQREMQAGGKLNHPHVVSTLDAAQEGETSYLVMEFVPGTDLASLVAANGPASVVDAVRHVEQAARGLAHAHEQGVIHRDVKPSNLLLTEVASSSTGSASSEASSPIVKVLDLGLARFLSSETHGELTGTGDVMGTADYMAPEQALSTRDVDGRADVYSLGCTLFFLLNGRPPYGGETAIARLLAHRDRPIPPLGQSNRAVPGKLDTIFQRMVAKSAKDRFATMNEVRAALNEFLVQHQASLNSRPMRRWLTVGFGLAVVAALVVAIMVNRGDGPRKSDAEPPPVVVTPDSTTKATETTNASQPKPPAPPSPTEILTSNDWEWTSPVEVGAGVNSPAHVNFAPSLTADGKTLFFARGPGPDSLWLSRRAALDQPWDEATRIPAPVNSDTSTAQCPTISGDGRILVFASDRAGGLGSFDLWMSTRAGASESFGEPVHLEGDINSTDTDRGPCLSEDGLTLIVSSGRNAGEGRCDLWMTTRPDIEAAFGPLVNLGPNINSSQWDESAALSSDGLTLIFGRMDESKPDQDLMISSRPSRNAPFGPASSLGPTINTPDYEFQPALSHDGRFLFFQSSRPGGPGAWNIFVSERVPKSKS